MREGTRDGDAGSSLELFREELARAHHLDWVALATFAVVGVPAMALVAFREIVEPPGSPVVIPLTAVALAAAAAHMLVRNASDYWVSFSRLRHLLLALAKEMELGDDSGDEMAERHCTLAEAMMLLNPPRRREAIGLHRIALELQPSHPRALKGLERLTARPRPASAKPQG